MKNHTCQSSPGRKPESHNPPQRLLAVLAQGVLALALVTVSCVVAGPARAQECKPVEIAKLLPGDGEFADYFGISIAIDNGIVAVGAEGDDDNGDGSGSAYLFDAATGTQLTKLLPNDGADGDEFGHDIALANGIVVVGAVGDNDNGDGSGSAYLFDAATGAQLAKLLPDDGAAGDRFGVSVAVRNGIVAVGAESNADQGDNSGSAYLFDADSGMQIAKLLPDDGAVGSFFGISVEIDGSIVAVGAQGGESSNGTRPGAAYLFDTATAAQLAKLLSSDGGHGDSFGRSIDIDNGSVVVGAFLDDDNGLFSGSAYVFDLGCTLCPPDLNGDGLVNTQDFLVFLSVWSAGEPLADWNNDGIINTLDFLAYLGDWSAGCP